MNLMTKREMDVDNIKPIVVIDAGNKGSEKTGCEGVDFVCI